MPGDILLPVNSVLETRAHQSRPLYVRFERLLERLEIAIDEGTFLLRWRRCIGSKSFVEWWKGKIRRLRLGS